MLRRLYPACMRLIRHSWYDVVPLPTTQSFPIAEPLANLLPVLRTVNIHARLNRVSVEVMGTECREHTTQCRQDPRNLM
jgi:hypothetical protein